MREHAVDCGCSRCHQERFEEMCGDPIRELMEITEEVAKRRYPASDKDVQDFFTLKDKAQKLIERR